MDITLLGHSSFKIRGKNATVVTDPYDAALVGMKFPKDIEATIVTVSHDHSDHNAVSAVAGSPQIINGPGEYDVAGVGIVGIASYHDNEKGKSRGKNTIYRIQIDGLSVVHLGDLGHMLTSDETENLDGVDILMIPVGGVFTIDAIMACAIVHDVDPHIVIPMHYGNSLINQKEFGSLLPLTNFLKEIGKEDVVPQSKLSISKDKLPEQLQVVILQ